MPIVNLPPSPFGRGRDPTPPAETLLDAAARCALLTVGIEEVPRGSNSGPEVRAWLKRCRINVPAPWCAAWASCVYQDAAMSLNIANPAPMTTSALGIWRKAPLAAQILKARAIDDPSLVRRGCLFVEDHGHGLGHCGIVLGVRGDSITVDTIEANTVPRGSRSRNGYLVARQEMRLDDPRLLGFVVYPATI